MTPSIALRGWVKAQSNPAARFIYRSLKRWSYLSLTGFDSLFRLLFQVRRSVLTAVRELRRVVWDTPLFRSQLQKPPREILVYGGVPQILGPVDITLGERCRISAQTTISGRSASALRPRFVVGDNCDIGWQTTIAVGTKIILGNNVRIAGRAFLAGYPGHPLAAQARAAGEPDLDIQCGAIVIEDDVWLATNVTVSAGVTIGTGTVVAAGSVVTHDLPPFVMAAGVPARPIRSLLSRTDSLHA